MDHQITIDGQTAPYWADRTDTRLTLNYRGRWDFDIPDPLARGTSNSAGGDDITAPMPGQIRAIAVAEGDEVIEGQPLGAMEAMKMEMTLNAPRDGRIAAIAVEVGAQVQAGAVLIRLETENG